MDSSRDPSFIDRLSLYSRELPYSQLRTREEAKAQQTIIHNRLWENNHEIPPYELQSYIGKGSYGRVYVARDTRPEGYGRVAIKILEVDAVDFQAHLIDRDQTAQDFLKELKTLQQIQSYKAPNVNKIYEVLEVYSQFWIISEYCPGGSVHTLMQATNNKVEEKYLLPIARELAIGLNAVHKASVIHRDIKAANVMIHEEGRLQIIDFGVAGTLVNQADKRTTVIGTPHWMGPEVFKGKDGKDKGYGTKADTWAYGCTLWEMATGRPPRSDIDMKNLEFALRTRAAPKLGLQEGYSSGLSELIAFTLIKDPDLRPSMEQVLEHPYLKGTELSYPTSSLKYFVMEFQDWAHQGGQRQSLFNPHGAAAAKVTEEIEKQPEWRFSTLESTEMMDRVSSDLKYQLPASFSNDTYRTSHLDQAADMSSIQAQEDAFNSYDASEPTSPYLSTSEATPGGSPTFQGASADLIDDQIPVLPTRLGATRTKVTRGGKQLGRLFDPRNSEYIYPSLTSSQSDLPLRNAIDDASASSSKGKVVDASEIGTSNSGSIALADPSTLKAKRLKDKDRPPTMAWDFATSEQMGMSGDHDHVNESQVLESQPQTLDMYQQSPAAWTPGEVNDYGSPGEESYDHAHVAATADYGSPGDGLYEDSYLGPPTSLYASAPKPSSNHTSAAQSFSIKSEDSENMNKARQTLDLDALMDNFGTPRDDVDKVTYDTPSMNSSAFNHQYSSSMTDNLDGARRVRQTLDLDALMDTFGTPRDDVDKVTYDTPSMNSSAFNHQYTSSMPDNLESAKKVRQTLDLDALMGNLDLSLGTSTTYAKSQLSESTVRGPSPFGISIGQEDPHDAHPIFGAWRPALPSTEVMMDGADDEVVYGEMMRLLTDHGRVLGGVADYYAQVLAQMDEEKEGDEMGGLIDIA